MGGPTRVPRAAVTMHEVAARARVSVKTVSNVVNNYPHVRPATRERVERAIRDLGYQVNASARSLRRGRTGVIGLALPELSLPYFAELADAFMAVAEERGVAVLIEHTGADPARELETLRASRRGMTDGLLFSPLGIGQEEVGALAVDYPLVLLGERIFSGPVDHVTMANVEGARAATWHLIERGCRRIAVVGAHPGEVLGSASLRIQGYTEALEAAGIPFDPALVVAAGLWHRASGADAINAAMDSGLEFDAVFGLNDALALGVLHALHQRRVSVPDQVKVIGFDDIDEASYSTPTLTSVAPGKREIARVAMDYLLERIESPQVLRAPRTFVAPFTIATRDSTA